MAKDLNTEQKIKEAARRVFLKKGFAAARTRDIAEEADINLALLNYYFRSKEKLFQQIMEESLHIFFSSVLPTMSNPEVSLKDKVPFFIENYTDMLIANPELPAFILSELRNDPDHIVQTLQMNSRLNLSVLFEQIIEAQKKGEVIEMKPWNFLLNLLSLTVFPFVARPLIERLSGMDDQQFRGLVEERKALIKNMVTNYVFTEKRKD